jgi:D-glycero-D-manno-heptose 1,7-bisphosphate phosphatase
VRRAAILDRDGTLIDFYRDPELGVVTPAFHPDHLRLMPGVVDGLRLLHDAGWLLAVATNQPDAAKGRLPRAAIERTNEALVTQLAQAGIPIAAFEVCLHYPDAIEGCDPALITRCGCRKPLGGMLDAIVARLGLAREASWMIGDTAADAGAAQAAGVRAGLLLPAPRCELCPIAPAAAAYPVHASAPRLDELARLVVAA